MKRAAVVVLVVSLLSRTAAADTKACIAAFEDGQIAEKKGQLLNAIDRFKACAATECHATLRADCTTALEAVERAVPTITLIARDANGKDQAATFFVDGKPVIVQNGRAIPVDPGPHVFRAELGDKQGSEAVTVHEGEKSRVLVISAASNKPAPSQPAPLAPAAPATVSSIDSAGPVVLGVLGIAAVAFSVGSVIAYKIEEDNLYAKHAVVCDLDGDPSCTRQESTTKAALYQDYGRNEREMRDDAPLHVALVIGGTLAIAGAITWYFWARASAKKSTTVGLTSGGFRF